MAEAVSIRYGDTLTRILNSKKGLQQHEIHSWLAKIHNMNPHISNLDNIKPGESVLIPDTLNESVLRTEIWQNAFSRIPQTLATAKHNTAEIYFVRKGDTIDTVAQYMFSSGTYRTLPHSTKRALLIHNNPFLVSHLKTDQLPENMVLNITLVKLAEMELNHWEVQQTPLQSAMHQMEAQLHEMVRQSGPAGVDQVKETVEELEEQGFSVGLEKTIKWAGYGVAGASGYAASGAKAVSKVNALARELYDELVKKFGKKTVHTAKASNLKKIQQFLKSHPKYREMMAHLRKLPKHLLTRKGSTALRSPQANHAIARNFRKHVSLPLKNLNNPSAYMNRMAKVLNGRVGFIKGIGHGATWVVPAVFCVASVANAPPELRVGQAFEEGFGVLGGAIGTGLGVYAGLGVIAFFGLGPFGAFIAIFICASLAGIGLNETGKLFGSKIYAAGSSLGGRAYYSIDELIGTL